MAEVGKALTEAQRMHHEILALEEKYARFLDQWGRENAHRDLMNIAQAMSIDFRCLRIGAQFLTGNMQKLAKSPKAAAAG